MGWCRDWLRDGMSMSLILIVAIAVILMFNYILIAIQSDSFDSLD